MEAPIRSTCHHWFSGLIRREAPRWQRYGRLIVLANRNRRTRTRRSSRRKKAWSCSEELAQDKLGISGREFVHRWYRGYYRADPDQPGVVEVWMARPLVEGYLRTYEDRSGEWRWPIESTDNYALIRGLSGTHRGRSWLVTTPSAASVSPCWDSPSPTRRKRRGRPAATAPGVHHFHRVSYRTCGRRPR